uniref:PRELI/MSF1 domain-containing protein n=1 Tax=Calidris pygmaea TaxID=425635 RepID=A0A8C3JXR5_9CHAR
PPDFFPRYFPAGMLMATGIPSQPHVTVVALTHLMVAEDNWTEVKPEAWVCSSLFGVSWAVQEFGLARFKTNMTKSTKGFEYKLTSPSKVSAENLDTVSEQTTLKQCTKKACSFKMQKQRKKKKIRKRLEHAQQY